MADQTIIVCDNNGNPTGEYVPKEVGHTGNGKHHLAITVLLLNSKGEVLLQKRKHKIFDNIWDLTGATHPLHKKDGTDEGLEEAAKRCLKVEYGIWEIGEIRVIGVFNYFAKYGEYCENEHCAILVGEYNGPISLNTQTGYEYNWMEKKEFLKDIKDNPKKYSPWANEGLRVLKKMRFFD